MIFSFAVCITAYLALAFAIALALIGTAGVAVDALGSLPSFLVPAAYGSALAGMVGAHLVVTLYWGF